MSFGHRHSALKFRDELRVKNLIDLGFKELDFSYILGNVTILHVDIICDNDLQWGCKMLAAFKASKINKEKK